MRNKFIISENERLNILRQHNSLNQSILEQSTGSTSASTTTVAEPRWKSLVNVNQVKAIQARMNDECPKDILSTVLEKYPKARTGSLPNYKLKEDGIKGKGTIAAFQACNGKWIIGGIGGVASTTGGGGAPLVQDPKIGEPINANDIATLTSL